MTSSNKRGYTLVELMVALGVFSIVVLLASGAYLMMISVTREAQGVSKGINNLSSALEVMTRNIRTGTNYACGTGGDCATGSGGTSFSFTNSDGQQITYRRVGTVLQEEREGVGSWPLTDPSVAISSLTFYVTDSAATPTNYGQPYVLMTIRGSVVIDATHSKNFFVQTSAAMRGTDL